jgi:hypothetical protein
VVTESFWASLRYFNFYRAAVAAVVLAGELVYPDTLNLGSHHPRVFMYTSATYLRWRWLFIWCCANGTHISMRS